MKPYTDINQSKKLERILPPESANMYYPYFGNNKWGEIARFGEALEYSGDKDIICWSLDALLDVINTNYYTTLYHDSVAWNIDIIHHDNVKEKHSVYAENPVDACYEIIIKLHKQKLL